jgi:hypothetical protein
MSDLAMVLLMLLLIGQGIRKMPGGPSRWLFPVLLLLTLPFAASPDESSPGKLRIHHESACAVHAGQQLPAVLGFPVRINDIKTRMN